MQRGRRRRREKNTLYVLWKQRTIVGSCKKGNYYITAITAAPEKKITCWNNRNMIDF